MQRAQESSAEGKAWVTIRRDPTSCDGASDCGWLVTTLNLDEPERRVDRIDLTLQPGLNEALVLDAPEGAIVLRGATRGSTFVASESFRGLPGAEPQPADAFVQVASEASARTRSIEPGLVTEVNTDASVKVPKFDFSFVDTPWLDRVWLRDVIYDRGAVVAGSFKGEPGIRGILRFEVNQVFVPLAAGSCPLVEPTTCARGTVATFVRGGDRCLVQTGCRTPGDCLRESPECAPGYVLRSWRTEPRGCFAYACDAAFLP